MGGDLEPGEWDELVRMGESYDFVGFWEAYQPAGWYAAERMRRLGEKRLPAVCSECWGTFVEFDTDGSLTGSRGAAVFCWCTGIGL